MTGLVSGLYIFQILSDSNKLILMGACFQSGLKTHLFFLGTRLGLGDLEHFQEVVASSAGHDIYRCHEAMASQVQNSSSFQRRVANVLDASPGLLWQCGAQKISEVGCKLVVLQVIFVDFGWQNRLRLTGYSCFDGVVSAEVMLDHISHECKNGLSAWA